MDEYSTGGGGKLKLKGLKVSDGRVKKKKSKKSSTSTSASTPSAGAENENDSKSGKERERDLAESTSQDRAIPREGSASGLLEEDASGTPESQPAKTEAERKHEEMRRKRVQERLKRDGSKTHKERVEELNKYLSRLSEHHDMPKIGPG
ncbi:hypothetical protein BJX70DRAFT_397363 [Aspergillus crustosus]